MQDGCGKRSSLCLTAGQNRVNIVCGSTDTAKCLHKKPDFSPRRFPVFKFFNLRSFFQPDYFFLIFFLNAASPTAPPPTKSMVAGSGTGVGGNS